MQTTRKTKKRVIITITPVLYQSAKKLEGNFSGTVEKALKEYLDAKRKKEIRENLKSRINDVERNELDIQLSKDFFHAESDLNK